MVRLKDVGIFALGIIAWEVVILAFTSVSYSSIYIGLSIISIYFDINPIVASIIVSSILCILFCVSYIKVKLSSPSDNKYVHLHLALFIPGVMVATIISNILIYNKLALQSITISIIVFVSIILLECIQVKYKRK